MTKEKTAVDYLINEFSAILGKLTTTTMQDLLLIDAAQKAKLKFEQQVKDAWVAGNNNLPSRTTYAISDEQYFKNKFE